MAGRRTRSAAGTLDAPGQNVAAKAGLNRSIPDAGWGQLVAFTTYKAASAGRTVRRVRAPLHLPDVRLLRAHRPGKPRHRGPFQLQRVRACRPCRRERRPSGPRRRPRPPEDQAPDHQAAEETTATHITARLGPPAGDGGARRSLTAADREVTDPRPGREFIHRASVSGRADRRDRSGGAQPGERVAERGDRHGPHTGREDGG